MSFSNDLRRVRYRLRRLENVAGASGNILIASHHNPDPDSIVSALLLRTLLAEVFQRSVTVCYSGVIGRAENQALLDYAGVELVALGQLDRGQFPAVALVDCQPGAGNNPFDEGSEVAMVFDHHRLRPETRRVAFFDVREHLGTTTTLLYLYWRMTKVELTPRFATAMLYALRSETADMGREASVVDRRLFRELYPVADLRALSKIVHAKVGEGYFVAIHEAIQRSVVRGPLIITRMDTLPYPDAVAQIAEYFLKYRGVSMTFSIGVYGGDVLFSLRSDDPGAQLGGVAQRIAAGLGTAGGHGSSAGGQVPVGRGGTGRRKAVQQTIIGRLLGELRLENERSRKLISHSPRGGGL